MFLKVTQSIGILSLFTLLELQSLMQQKHLWILQIKKVMSQ